MPQNDPDKHDEDSGALALTDSNWRNAALDCVDTLHWAANGMIASLLGAEHPTVLHLHFSRVVLLVPREMLMTLAKYIEAPEDAKKMASNQQKALQAEREISKWAQKDGVSQACQYLKVCPNNWSVKSTSRSFALWLLPLAHPSICQDGILRTPMCALGDPHFVGLQRVLI
jgi:hypothetical protein